MSFSLRGQGLTQRKQKGTFTEKCEIASGKRLHNYGADKKSPK
jgi:hypothetical protein